MYKRLQLDETDIHNMEQAINITTKTFNEICKQISTYKTETAVSGYLKGRLHSEYG